MRSRCCRTKGATLVEVMAGLVLLGTLLVAVINAKAGHVRQWSRANDRLQAIAAADALLDSWWQNPAILPRSAGGQTGTGPWRWRTRLVDNYQTDNLPIQIVRLELYNQTDSNTMNDPLVIVDLVLPDETLP